MKKYEILLRELDRCEYIVDYQYTGKLLDYTYNSITIEQREAYFQILEDMYHNFLTEWADLSDMERKSARGLMELIVAKRFIYDEFFFDVPTSEMIVSMIGDNGVPRQSVEIARFVHDLAEQQKFYLERVAEFMEIVLERKELHLTPVDESEDEDSIETTEEDDFDESNIDNTVYQTLHKKFGDTVSAEQLSKFFKVHTRTLYDWERKGYITNISAKSDDTTSAGHKKRGEEKRYLTSDIAKNIEMQRKFNKL